MIRAFLILMLLCLTIFCQAQETSFRLPMQSGTRGFSVNKTFTQTDSIDVDLHSYIESFAISGSIEQKEKSFIRILLEDKLGQSKVVLETSKLYNDVETFFFSHHCEETSGLSDFQPKKMKIFTRNATLYLDSIYYVEYNAKSHNALRLEAQKRSKSMMEERISKINKYNKEHGELWLAGETRLSSLTWQDKKRAMGFFSDDADTGGMEYYIGGVFVIRDVQHPSSNERATAEQTSLYVDSFDWRNRHGKNWNTNPKDQGQSGYCAAFAACGMLEARVNLLYNKRIDLDLSEQDIVYNYARRNYNLIDTIWNRGMIMSNVMRIIKEDGVLDEVSEPFINSIQHTVPPRPVNADSIRINSSGRIYSGNTEQIKQKLIHNGPLTGGFETRYQNHAMTLVGYHKIQVGDTVVKVDSQSTCDSIIVPEGSPFIGKTYWIFKDNYGTNVPQRINGYFNLCFNSYQNMSSPFFTESDILGTLLDGEEVVISDEDGDGYYFWGIGPKPANCPDWIPDEPDGDDSDDTLGPMNEYGFLYSIPEHINDTIFIDNDTIWNKKQFLYRHVVVQNHATLTINSDIQFYKDVEMTLSDGAKLVLNGGRLLNAVVNAGENQGTSITVLNNGGVETRQYHSFKVPLGTTFNIENGIIN